MMNKKAIAAFAAGATLLAGFAAAPAFADADTDAKIADLKTSIALLEAKMRNNNLQPSEAVLNSYNQAKANFKEADEAFDAAYAAYKAGYDAYVAANPGKTHDEFDNDESALYGPEGNKSGKDLSAAIETAQNAYNEAKDTFNKAKNALAAYNSGYAQDVADLKALKEELAKLVGGETPDHTTPDHTKPDHTKPVQPAKPGSKLEAVKNVLAKKVDVDAASHVFAEKKEAYTKAAATLTAAKGELDAAKHDAAVAQQALSDFDASGVNDSAARERLQGVLDRANAHVVRTQNAFDKALVDFNAAKTADLAAQAAYNLAKAAYDAAYNEAIKLGVNPDLLPSVTAIDPLSPAFPQLAQAQKIYADALAGKFGAAAQKAVQKAEAKAQAAAPAAAAGKAGAAAGKAAAKGELATKGGNGHGKAGEKLGNAGVGVALTALAASMLAGMGAAVRKMRH